MFKKKLFVIVVFYSMNLNSQNNSLIENINNLLKNFSSEQQTTYENTASILRCPTCTGLSVLDSDAMFSLQIRKKVAELVTTGSNQKQIIEFFKSRYGIWILREPPLEGFHVFAWAAPLLVFFLGLLWIWFVFWNKSRKSEVWNQKTENEFQKELSKFKSINL